METEFLNQKVVWGEQLGLGLSLMLMETKSRITIVWACFLKLGEEASSHVSCCLFLLVTFFSHQTGEKRAWAAGGVMLDRISEQYCHHEEVTGRSPKGFLSERTFLSGKVPLWRDWRATPSLSSVPPPEAVREPGLKVGFSSRGWPLGRQDSQQLPGSPGTGSRGVGSGYSPRVGGTRGSH